MRRTAIALLSLLLVGTAGADEKSERALVLRPIPLAEGVGDVMNRSGDPTTLRKTEQCLRAKR